MSSAAPTAEKTKSHAGKFLTFKLGSESYAVEVLKIKEIIRMQRVTPVPHLPPYMRGIINLRGKVIPVVDLRLKFGLETIEETERTCIVVVQIRLNGDNRLAPVGMVVDAVDEVLNISDEQVEDNPDLGSTLENRFIQGLAKFEDIIVTLLDIDRLIREDDVLAVQ
ncbi:MAG: chemotaxis protein CheW [Opitutales bacterium]